MIRVLPAILLALLALPARGADVEVTVTPSTMPAVPVEVDGQTVLVQPASEVKFKLPDPERFQEVTLKWIAALTTVIVAAFGLFALVWGKVKELKAQNVEQENRQNRQAVDIETLKERTGTGNGGPSQ